MRSLCGQAKNSLLMGKWEMPLELGYVRAENKELRAKWLNWSSAPARMPSLAY